ncbi:MAG: hypothetical protein JSS55_12885 [Proteobacteria bacterium]|nr:hypothetical protein [Pseudomonadota bacterium]
MRQAAALMSLMTGVAVAAPAQEPAKPAASDEAHTNIPDPDIRAWHALTYDRKPPAPVPGKDYGMDPATRRFVHPKATPLTHDAPNFPGQLDYWDSHSYAKNVDQIAFYPYVVSPGHTWQAIADFDGRRYMYIHYRAGLAVFDITDPRSAKLVWSGGSHYGAKGATVTEQPIPWQDGVGASNIEWSPRLGKYVMVQSHEIQRYGVMDEKLDEPAGVARLKHWPDLKGFKVFEMNGPLPPQWKPIAERTTDYLHPDAPRGQQQGSGSLDVPAWWGGKYMFLSTAPDDRFMLTEFPDYIYTPGFQAWDMSDPANPKFVSQFAAPGQILGDPEHEAAFLTNPRAGNRTSWFGSRMPPFMTKPVEQGGKYAFGAMAGLGLYTLDVSDPAQIKIVGHLNVAPKFAGTEFDNVDVSQFERTGYVFSNGYPMNDECYEPYKDIFVIDAHDMTAPKVVAKFPRPTPPEGAPFTDFCQRHGSFGPKRPGYPTQPGRGRDGVVAYAFYNAGVQIFDVKDPTKPSIAGYFVPRMPTLDEVAAHSRGNLTYGIFVEYDRNVIWAFTNHGFYALTTPLLGKPLYRAPDKPWPPRP